MFQSEELDNHLKTSHTIETETVVFAEWNLNNTGNVEKIGNYRYRPGTTDNQFSIVPTNYDPLDEGGYYTGATDADVSVISGFDDQDQPTLFTTPIEKMKLLYSLEDCIKPHRPRSGINKLLYLDTDRQYLDIGDKTPEQETLNIARRPRYYMASRQDQFKYWTSYRTKTEDGEPQELGISQQNENGLYYINDAAPFVVYNDVVPTNKIIVKMQTNVGSIDLGPFRVGEEEIQDPLYGYNNQTTPVRWRIQGLKNNNWIDLILFDQNSTDENGDPIIKNDGYVEISYGINIPEPYATDYIYAGEIADSSLLPDTAPYGYTYLIKSFPTDRGEFKFYDAGDWITITPEYSWKLTRQTIDIRTPVVTKTSNPDFFIDNAGETVFREFEFIRGIRIVVETMNVPECTFDLIEMSPRLMVDIIEKVSSFNVTKTMSDLGNGSVPVGSIFASTGTIELFDDDFSFNSNNIFDFETNTGSIVSQYVDMRTKFNIYNVVRNIDEYDYFIPLKSMYVDEIPSVSNSTGTVSLTLRDFFFFLESSKAPELLITDCSISYAVTLLLDYIGFSNYVFRRVENIPEIIIPFFFIGPDQNVAEVLQQLAVASQTAMFFDEYNNFIVMSKEYLLPELDQRETDSFLYGQEEGENLPNIINLSSEEKRIYNEGKINYTTRYIQRAVSKYRQAPFTDRYKTYGYKPALLWEVAAKEQLRSQNELPQASQGYVLSAAALNTTLTADVPVVENFELINNIIDVGENIDNVSSYQGYFYANGEVIRYDAMQYAIVGPLDDGEEGNLRWITSNLEYQRYFSRLPFNGKMYATGNLRIYTEPEYETVDEITRLKNGAVKKHGRGQFGTPVVEHQAGLNPYWSDDAHVAGCLQQASDYLFNTSEIIDYPELSASTAGKIDESIEGITYFDSDVLSTDSTRNGIIKNFRADKYYTENEVNYFDTARVGTLQSSALVFNGPEIPEAAGTQNFVSYVYKELEDPYKHFGTRMRIIGKIESTNQKSETPFGAFPIYRTQDLDIDDPEQNIQILGGAGGIAFGLNKDTNNGYYFEIVSLTQDNIEQYIGNNKEKIVSYNISDVSCTNNVVTATSETAVDFVVGQKLLIQGLVDSGNTSNTRTPLNGEYSVTAINTNGKTFQYEITSPSITSLSITSASAVGDRIKYIVPVGISRESYIKPGDKVNISGTSNSNFNVNNAIVKSFIQTSEEWYFTIEKTTTGSATGGTVSYVPLTTTSQGGGTASISGIGNNNLANIFFYKILADENGKAIPYKLWSGIANILVDDGKFTGQYRFFGEENVTVYDLAAEYVNIGNDRRFFLYINDKQIATVTDTDPLPEYNHMALFVRGTSRCMFENIYALGANISQNSSVPIGPKNAISQVFGDDEVDASEALRKYAISGIIQKTYLSGIGSEEPPAYIMYFDEFGTIMREAAYLNIKYDRAFPALYARVMRTFNRLKGYSISGFYSGSYGADFLIFNCLDTNVNLDDTTGNFLRIQGITFTQNTTKTLSVDNYYKRLATLSDPITSSDGTLVNPFVQREEYNRIINSRSRYGLNEFTLESPYIQTDDVAENIFGWTMGKVSVPKILVGINTFATQNLQLGDIVKINYKNNDGLNIISDEDKRFVVYNIEYSKNNSEETMTMYLAEV